MILPFSRYTLWIAAYQDDGTFTTGAEKLDIVINNLNRPPQFTNLPAVITLREDFAGQGTVLFRVLYFFFVTDTNMLIRSCKW